MTSVAAAEAMARRVLADSLPRRWSHVSGVASRARELAPTFACGETLESAAWLHDIGYAPGLVETGFHALDGARYLRRQGVDDRLVGLVAYHSLARLEAAERGLHKTLSSEFVDENSSTTDALCYCDMTTGPDGQRVAVQDRLNEIRSRYGPHDLVTRFINRAEPDLLASVARTESLLSGASADYPM